MKEKNKIDILMEQAFNLKYAETFFAVKAEREYDLVHLSPEEFKKKWDKYDLPKP